MFLHDFNKALPPSLLQVIWHWSSPLLLSGPDFCVFLYVFVASHVPFAYSYLFIALSAGTVCE